MEFIKLKNFQGIHYNCENTAVKVRVPNDQPVPNKITLTLSVTLDALDATYEYSSAKMDQTGIEFTHFLYENLTNILKFQYLQWKIDKIKSKLLLTQWKTVCARDGGREHSKLESPLSNALSQKIWKFMVLELQPRENSYMKDTMEYLKVLRHSKIQLNSLLSIEALSLLNRMVTSTRSTSKDNALMVEEEFFMNLPTPKLKERMKKAVSQHIDGLENSGINLLEFKDRKGLTAKIAEHLREKKVGGWADLQVKYQKPSEYRMYKSLVDRVTYELKLRSLP